jgi:hypothetical protein
MEEKTLIRLSLLCCTFGLVMLYVVSQQTAQERTPISVLKSQNNKDVEDLQITGKIISLQEYAIRDKTAETKAERVKNAENNTEKPNTESSDNEKGKRTIKIRIQTNDIIDVFLFDDKTIPLKKGDNIEVRGTFQKSDRNSNQYTSSEQKADQQTDNRKNQPTILAEEVRTIS